MSLVSIELGEMLIGCSTFIAALEKAEGVKPSDVEEVFFGNVISAK